MAFAALLAADKPQRGERCSVAIWLSTQAADDRAEAISALGDHSIQTATIHRAMKAMGYTAASSAVQRHRRRDCKCPSQTN